MRRAGLALLLAESLFLGWAAVFGQASVFHGINDKTLHFSASVVLAATLYWTVRQHQLAPSTRGAFTVVAMLVFAFGSEVVQGILTGGARPFDLLDAMADVYGSVAGVMLALGVHFGVHQCGAIRIMLQLGRQREVEHLNAMSPPPPDYHGQDYVPPSPLPASVEHIRVSLWKVMRVAIRDMMQWDIAAWAHDPPYLDDYDPLVALDGYNDVAEDALNHNTSMMNENGYNHSIHNAIGMNTSNTNNNDDDNNTNNNDNNNELDLNSSLVQHFPNIDTQLFREHQNTLNQRIKTQTTLTTPATQHAHHYTQVNSPITKIINSSPLISGLVSRAGIGMSAGTPASPYIGYRAYGDHPGGASSSSLSSSPMVETPVRRHPDIVVVPRSITEEADRELAKRFYKKSEATNGNTNNNRKGKINVRTENITNQSTSTTPRSGRSAALRSPVVVSATGISGIYTISFPHSSNSSISTTPVGRVWNNNNNRTMSISSVGGAEQVSAVTEVINEMGPTSTSASINTSTSTTSATTSPSTNFNPFFRDRIILNDAAQMRSMDGLLSPRIVVSRGETPISKRNNKFTPSTQSSLRNMVMGSAPPLVMGNEDNSHEDYGIPSDLDYKEVTESKTDTVNDMVVGHDDTLAQSMDGWGDGNLGEPTIAALDVDETRTSTTIKTTTSTRLSRSRSPARIIVDFNAGDEEVHVDMTSDNTQGIDVAEDREPVTMRAAEAYIIMPSKAYKSRYYMRNAKLNHIGDGMGTIGGPGNGFDYIRADFFTGPIVGFANNVYGGGSESIWYSPWNQVILEPLNLQRWKVALNSSYRTSVITAKRFMYSVGMNWFGVELFRGGVGTNGNGGRYAHADHQYGADRNRESDEEEGYGSVEDGLGQIVTSVPAWYLGGGNSSSVAIEMTRRADWSTGNNVTT